MQGPNVKKLIVRKMTMDAVPSGGGIADGLNFLADRARILQSARDATEWVMQAIQAVREAVEPNPYKDANDETIAGVILERIAEKARNSK